MVGHRTGQEAVASQRGHMGGAGEVEQHVGAVLQRIRFDDLNRQCRPEHFLHHGEIHRPHVARLVRGAQQIGRAGRCAAVGGHAAIDQLFGFGQAGSGQAHGRAQGVAVPRPRHTAVEIGAGPGRLAAFGAPGRVKAQGKGAGDRHAVHAVRLRPGERIRLHALGRLAVDLTLEIDEFLATERGAARLETHADQIGVGDAALALVVGRERHAVRVVLVDDDAELAGREMRLFERRQHRSLRCGRRGPGQERGQQAECGEAARRTHRASAATHSRTSAGPR